MDGSHKRESFNFSFPYNLPKMRVPPNLFRMDYLGMRPGGQRLNKQEAKQYSVCTYKLQVSLEVYRSEKDSNNSHRCLDQFLSEYVSPTMDRPAGFWVGWLPKVRPVCLGGRLWRSQFLEGEKGKDRIGGRGSIRSRPSRDTSRQWE